MELFNRKELVTRRSKADLNKSGFIFDIVCEELKHRVGTQGNILVLGSRNIIMDLGEFKAKRIIYADIFPGDNINIVLDSENLPFAPESFNIIFSILDLHSINNVQHHLHQINHILKKNGVFVAALFGEENLKTLRQAFLDAELALNKPVSMHIHPTIDIKTIGMLMQNAGFSSIIVDNDRINVVYNSFNKILQDLKQMGEGNILLSRAKTPISKAVLKKTAELLFAGQSEIIINFEILYVTAIKN